MATLRKPDSPVAPQQRVFGYARVSTDKQSTEGVSLGEQQRRIEAQCLAENWQLESVYVDAGVSGSVPLGKRPQGAKLLAALRPGDAVIAARMDRFFRSATDALETIASFRKRRISLFLLDLGNSDCSGNGISELLVTILAAVAQFERSLISERIKAAKTALRHSNRHLGGLRPFGFRYGEATGKGRARDLVPDEAEQVAIADIVAMRGSGATLMAIRDQLRGQGFAISHQSVANILARQEGAAG
jgi:putative DNA-invertase from lambdoid prophage Rac